LLACGYQHNKHKNNDNLHLYNKIIPQDAVSILSVNKKSQPNGRLFGIGGWAKGLEPSTTCSTDRRSAY
jgi:hypothetical protein